MQFPDEGDTKELASPVPDLNLYLIYQTDAVIMWKYKCRKSKSEDALDNRLVKVLLDLLTKDNGNQLLSLFDYDTLLVALNEYYLLVKNGR